MRRTSALLAAMAIMVGCHRSDGNTKAYRNKGPVLFAQAFVSEIVPIADGGAYIVTDRGLWYVRGAETKRVRFGQQDAPDWRTTSLEVVPTINGGAYAISLGGPTVWYLREEQAYRVIESKTISSRAYTPLPEDKFFGLYLAELRKRRAAELVDGSSQEQEEPQYEQ